MLQEYMESVNLDYNDVSHFLRRTGDGAVHTNEFQILTRMDDLEKEIATWKDRVQNVATESSSNSLQQDLEFLYMDAHEIELKMIDLKQDVFRLLFRR